MNDRRDGWRHSHSEAVQALLTVLIWASAAVFMPEGASVTQMGLVTSVTLDVRGQGFPVYRIPAVARTTAGTLIAAYDGRPTDADVPGNIALVLRRSLDNGASWLDRQVVRYEAGTRGYGDPSLLVDRTTGRIFLFHAAAVNQGFFGSAAGNDEEDPEILQMDYSYSDDDGLTWRHERITKEAKNPAWAGVFASSREGIQIARGRFAGRLIQQYVIRYRGENWAASLYSDDHGRRWVFGSLVGPGMDENKIVELSDGTLLLNSRAPGGYRRIAHSSDGGATFSGLRHDTSLVDPANNASIVRYDLRAPPDSAEARVLPFSNTEDATARRNLTIKVSCDDGRTWPIRRTVDPGAAAYSTVTALGDGAFGMLYEKASEATGRIESIQFARLDGPWLGVARCSPSKGDPEASLIPGSTGWLWRTAASLPGRVAQAGDQTHEAWLNSHRIHQGVPLEP